MDHRLNLLNLLRTWASYKSLKRTKILHQKVISFGLQNDHRFCKFLVEHYLSLHLVEPAQLILKGTQDLHLSLCNAMLAAYAKNNFFQEALNLFNTLRFSSRGILPDCYTFPSVLKACNGLGNAMEGRKIHALVLKSGLVRDVVIASSLVGMYARCHIFDSAVQVFNGIPTSELDVPCWNTVISCYCQDGRPSDALLMYKRMISYGFKPDSMTYTVVFSACARSSDLEMGRKIHMDLIVRGFDIDGFMSASLVDMYCKCGHLEIAKDVFENIPTKCTVSWNSMIGGYSLIGDSISCLGLFILMHDQGLKPTSTTISSLLIACSRSSDLPNGKFIHGYTLRNSIQVDIFIYTALVDLYFKCGYVSYAESVFRKMPKDNVISWNVMMSGYVSIGSYFKAIDVFYCLEDIGVRPDIVSYASALSACSQLAALEQGKKIHHCISNHQLESNEIIMGALLDMYAKCGAVDEARHVFDRLPVRDIISWTSMIMAYGSHGQALEAIKLFDCLKKSNKRPDHVTFLAVISACAHGGLVDEGYFYFNQMGREYGIEPRLEHYSCLIDLLGRAGRLEEAYRILQGNPSMKTDAGLLGSLFNACCLYKNLQMGEEIAGLLMSLDPDDHSTYISLANLYASVGRWVDARNMRLKMKLRGLKKNPGCSWIEIDKMIHQFFVEDDSHPLAKMIYECLETLGRHMKKKEKKKKKEYPGLEII